MEDHFGYLLLLPLLIVLVVFYLYPILQMSSLAFFDAGVGIDDLDFVGLRNFSRLAANPAFTPSIINSILWTFFSAVIQLIIPIGLALLLNRKFRGVNVVRSLILIPWITPAVVTAIMWRWLLEPHVGMLNEQLLSLGILSTRISFLGDTTLALPTLIVINSITYIPFGTLLILAALQNIPQSLYDAMSVDGASSFQKLRYLILPLIGPMIGFVGFLILVWNFNIFDIIQLTTEGGPANATMTIPVLIYRTAYQVFNLGQAGALAVIVVIFLVLAGIAYFKFIWSGEGGNR